MERPLLACAVERRRFPVGASPTRQPLQPEAIGAVMEVTKWLKPSISVSRIGDSASVQAATRVNAEQASKRTMCRPTRLPYRGRLKWLGALSEDYAHPLHRGIGGSMYTRKAHAKRRASGLRAALDFLHLLLREPLVGPLLEWPGCRLSVLVELLLGARVFTFLEQIFGLVALAPR